MISLFPLFLISLSAWGSSVNAQAKNYPGAAGWPTSAAWQELGQATGGRLSKCPATECTSSQGAYVLAAKTAQDVSAGMKFATANKVRVSVKGTGHDFMSSQNRNGGSGSLLIYTRTMKGYQIVPEWVATGAPNGTAPQAAVGIAGGTAFEEVYPFVERERLMIVHGATASVGAAGGWIQGGGHGPLSNQYGMGCDNALEFEIVVPSGAILIANDYQNQDLFFALRGGGGGTFGIVTRLITRAYPLPTMNGIQISVRGRGYLDAMAYLFAMTPNMTDFGLSGYPTMSGSSYSSRLRAPGKTAQEISEFFNPIAERMRQLGVTVSLDQVVDRGTTSKRELFKEAAESEKLKARQLGGLMTSRLLARDALNEGNIPAIRKMLSSVTGGLSSVLPYPNAGGRVAQNRDLDTGLNPAWRDAVMHMIVMGIGGSPVSAMDPLSANHGAYLNEASPSERDWKTTFFGGGEHYARLLEVKKKYDPTNTLWCTPCVGGDLLVERSGRLYDA
ncbi:FAD-binding domain-containing protein [Eremomyces bilateralis CBS 781.70]|uniref:FAD-binding domain-containing protein n=1 Tax=Eremomyces bilateralis CBS 781.70 TaxID=1392243 RepID=A0A6G1FSB4_9PEZI|nr:FAD-binding domain-containing protein [Eremomyces bilateralis CBS 781.70]KAF1808610.1 FAD-binding domain-containing protein [Eremomyces bilateralis CBS 781.70]